MVDLGGNVLFSGWVCAEELKGSGRGSSAVVLGAMGAFALRQGFS